jgi:hypothetical protein
MVHQCCSTLFDFFLPSSAEILGTMKRSPAFPFHFDQKAASIDKRQVVETKGFKTIFLKKLANKDKQLTAIEYCDGKGGITLGINSSEQTQH